MPLFTARLENGRGDHTNYLIDAPDLTCAESVAALHVVDELFAGWTLAYVRPYVPIAIYAKGKVVAAEHYDHEDPGSNWGECLSQRPSPNEDLTA